MFYASELIKINIVLFVNLSSRYSDSYPAVGLCRCLAAIFSLFFIVCESHSLSRQLRQSIVSPFDSPSVRFAVMERATRKRERDREAKMSKNVVACDENVRFSFISAFAFSRMIHSNRECARMCTALCVPNSFRFVISCEAGQHQ